MIALMLPGVGGNLLRSVRAGAFVDDERRISGLIFQCRAVVLVLLLAAAAVLPATGDGRWGIVGLGAAVALPYDVLLYAYTRRTGRLPTAMVYLEAVLPAVVAFVYPVLWAPMLLITIGDVGLHAVLFSRRAAFAGNALATAAFAVVGAMNGPSTWSLGVVVLAVCGSSAIIALSAVAELERSARRRFTTMLEGADAVLVELDPSSGRFTYVSPGVESVLGYPWTEWLDDDRFWHEHIHPEDRERAARTYWAAIAEGRSFDCEFRMITADGRVVWINAMVSVETDSAGRPVCARGVLLDVTERHAAEEALRHQALHDALTGLPNRSLLQDRLRCGIAEADGSDGTLALLLMDLDEFKEINDTLGHAHGDRLLAQMGRRLQSVVRECDTVARLGGDEFAVIVPGAGRRGAEVVARKIESALEFPFELDDTTVQVATSIGIALFPLHGRDSQTLIQRADVAMYAAKRDGGGHAVYDPGQDRFSLRRLELISELRTALTAGELVLYYQPKLDLRSGHILSVESLVRWRHPEQGLLSPDRFIALAEVSGLVRNLTLWVLDEALRQCRAWMDDGVDLAVAVNVSARDLHDTELADRVAVLLERWRVPADRLIVEITENEIMRDRHKAAQVLRRLSAMNVRLSIDDFGTGFSSLADLRQLPIDEIKVDRSFVVDMTSDINDAVIVRSIIDLGHNLGLNVVAEGVENQEVRRRLEDLGCDEAQGFDICVPLPGDDLQVWLAAFAPRSFGAFLPSSSAAAPVPVLRTGLSGLR